jgi:hypothetical protein
VGVSVNLRPPPTMAKFKSCFLNSSVVDGKAAVSKPKGIRPAFVSARKSTYSQESSF